MYCDTTTATKASLTSILIQISRNYFDLMCSFYMGKYMTGNFTAAHCRPTVEHYVSTALINNLPRACRNRSPNSLDFTTKSISKFSLQFRR